MYNSAMTYNLYEEYVWKAKVPKRCCFIFRMSALFYFYTEEILFVPNTIAEAVYNTIRKASIIYLALYNDWTIVTLKIFKLEIDSNFT